MGSCGELWGAEGSLVFKCLPLLMWRQDTSYIVVNRAMAAVLCQVTVRAACLHKKIVFLHCVWCRWVPPVVWLVLTT